MRRRLIFGAALLAAAACSSSSGDPKPGSDGGGPAAGTLLVRPGDVTLEVKNQTPASQSYEVFLVEEDGSEVDVTDEARFTIGNPVLGSFEGNLFTTAPDRAGRTAVTATYEDKTGRADLTVLLEHVIIGEGVSGDAPDLFDGASPGGSEPSLVYPETGIIVPPNMNTLEVHFLPGGNDVFELEFVGSLVTLKIYLSCSPLNQGCLYEPNESTWELLATAGKGEEPVFYTLSGLDSGAAEPKVGLSATHQMSFSGEDLLGGIYYWNAGAGSIKRYEFGLRGQQAEDYLTVAQTGGTQCVGCHVLSRDGERIAVGLDVPGPAKLETYEVASRNMLWGRGGALSGEGSNFAAFSPDASQILTSGGTDIQLQDAADGAGATTVIESGTMPTWSPSGGQVVYAEPASQIECPFPGACATPGINEGSLISTVPGDWGNRTTLVASSGDNNYYPSFSPDGEWIVFNKSQGESYDAPDAEVWVISADGGEPIRLENASPEPGGDSWPKWGPFIHAYKDGQVMWLTFSSRRDYGLRLVNSELPEEDQRAQIWMVGFDPARAAAGEDGSFAAFWLPFQDLSSGNHIAQWVEEVDRQECDPGECPSGEFCEGGECYPDID